MFWIILSVITALLFAIIVFFDNYATDVVFAKKHPQAVKVFNSASYLIIACLIMFFYKDLQSFEIITILPFIAAGIISSLSSIPYYQALKYEESTSAAIFYQIQPIIYLGASALLFGNILSTKQFIAFALLIVAPFIVILTRKNKKAKRLGLNSSLLFLAHIALLVTAGLIFTNTSRGFDHLSCFMYFTFGRGISDFILVMFRKDWRQDFKDSFKRYPHRLPLILLTIQLLTVTSDFTNLKALTDGETSIASAIINSSELIFTFLLGIILTKIWPNFGREKLEKRTIISHACAIAFCLPGIIIIAIA